jgi:DNA-binding SARP family transcriptional activator
LRTVRIILAGPVSVSGPDGAVIVESDFPSRQARRAFAYLVRCRVAGATSEQLAAALWPGDPPPAWRSGVAALVSKLRQLFANRLDGVVSIGGDFGVYRLDLPGDTWIDLDAALERGERADAALKNGDIEGAGANHRVASAIGLRPFLPGEEGAWIESVRAQLQQTRIRALESLVRVHLRTGTPGEAARWAEELVDLDPYRDQAYVAFMQALAAAGNPSRAIAVFLNMRTLLAEELGIDPSPEAEAVYLDILRRSEGRAAIAPQASP